MPHQRGPQGVAIADYQPGIAAALYNHDVFLLPCRLLTLGDSPVIAVEELDPKGQQLLQQGLQPPPLPAAAGVQQLQQQVGDLGLGLESAGAGSDADGRSSEDLSHRQSLTGVESRVPKEIQRLVHFLQVGSGSAGQNLRPSCPLPCICAPDLS